MTPWQWAYGISLALVLLPGLATKRPGALVSGVLIADFLATMALAADPVSVAVVDITAASILVLFTWGFVARLVAVLFAVMVLVEVGGTVAGVDHSAVYTVVDILGYCWIAAIGGGHVGPLLRLRRARRRGRDYPMGTPVAGLSARGTSRAPVWKEEIGS